MIAIENFTNIISSLPTAIAIVDTEMRYLAASDKWIEDYGLQGKNFKGISHYDVFPEIGEEWKKIHADCLQGKAKENPEDKFIRLDGTVQWLSWEVKPWINNEGKIGGIIMYSKDITNSIVRNQELQRNLQLYEDTNEAARIGSWEINHVNQTVFWSRMVREILELGDNFSVNNTNAHHFLQEGENKDTLKQLLNDAIQSRTTLDYDMELKTIKGNKLWVRIRGEGEFKEGKCVRLFGTIQDIQQLKLQSILLKDSEEKYKSIIQNSLSALFLIRQDGTILEANQVAEKMFGYSLKELKALGRSGIMDTSDPKLADYIKFREKQGYAKADLIGIRKNGEHFPVEISSVTFTDSNNTERTSVSMVDITNRVKAEEELRLSEAQFRAAFEYSGIGMALVGLDGRWTRVNSSFCKIVGYSAKELLPRTFQELTHPDDLDNDTLLIREMLEGKRQSYHLEKRFLHKNGTVIFVLLASSLILDKDQKPSHRIIQVQDITDRKNNESALREERELLSTLINNIPINIFVKDLKSRKTLVNKAEVEYWGAGSADMLLGKDDYELYPMYLARMSIAEDQEVFNSGKAIINREKTITWSDGSIRSILTSKIPLFDNEGKITGLLGINYDISIIKNAEIALFESEKKFRNIFENIQDVFYQSDKHGIVVEVSPSIEKHSGYTRDEVIGKPVTDFYFKREDSSFLIESLKADRMVNDFELQLKTKSGEMRYASVNAQVIIRNGEFLGTEGSMRDVTERKLQDDSLRLLNNDLNLLNDQKNKLLSVIAHDLRNAISGSVGLLEVVFMEVDDISKDDLLEYMAMLQKSILNAHGLLEDLLEWARAQFHSVDFNPAIVSDLRGQVRHCLKKLEPIADAKEIQIEEDLEENITIRMDKYMLDSILRNLVTNAVKFTKKGGQVKVSVQSRQHDFLFSVSDNGVGIPPSVVNKLFSEKIGFTSYGTSGEKGTGMGLGICRNFVEKHGGKIWTESIEGKGSTFYFTIPILKDVL